MSAATVTWDDRDSSATSSAGFRRAVDCRLFGVVVLFRPSAHSPPVLLGDPLPAMEVWYVHPT